MKSKRTRRRSRCALLVGRWPRGANPLRWVQRGGEAQAAQKWAWWTLLSQRHALCAGSSKGLTSVRECDVWATAELTDWRLVIEWVGISCFAWGRRIQ